MKYLTSCMMLFFISAANAETPAAGSDVKSPAQNNDVAVQQATQSIATKLIGLLDLTTVTEAEKETISLKDVVLKALQEGKSMTQIRTETNKALNEVTGQTVELETTSNESSPSVNLAEITVDPATGKKIAVVQPGESIFRLAQRVYGKENGGLYIKIFAANSESIKDINVVVQGQRLIIPD